MDNFISNLIGVGSKHVVFDRLRIIVL